MQLPKRISLIMLILLSSGLVSCSEKVNVTANVQSPSSDHQKPAIHKTTKPGAMVSLVTPSLIEIAENKTTSLNIDLKTSIKSGKMEVSISALDGLQLITKDKRIEFVLNGTDVYSIPIDVIAAKQGRYYVNLAISIDDGEVVSMRTLAVIIQAGKVIQMNREQKTQSSLDGAATLSEKIIVMPAQETIK